MASDFVKSAGNFSHSFKQKKSGMNLQGKTAIITGSSKGIGKAIALELADKGASVVVNYLQGATNAHEVTEQIKNAGGNAVTIQADVSKPEEIARLFDESIKYFKTVDILVNNAGKAVYVPVNSLQEEIFDELFSVNVKSIFFALKEAAEKIAVGGKIINISSTVTRIALPAYGLYSATKASIEQITKVFAKEIGHKGITVNAVSPGPTNTELFTQNQTAESLKAIAAMSVFNRLGEVEDIAKVVAFLCSDEAKWITGQNILVNGGMAS